MEKGNKHLIKYCRKLGNTRTVALYSRMLIRTESNYLQILQPGLSILWAFTILQKEAVCIRIPHNKSIIIRGYYLNKGFSSYVFVTEKSHKLHVKEAEHNFI